MTQRVAANQERPGPVGPPTRNRRATGAAVRPYRVTVATITRKVAGRILDAPPIPLAARAVPNVEAVAAATIPRGAIQPMNARSPFGRSVFSVDAKAATGRATMTRAATRTSVGSIRCRSDCGVTVAEMEMNSTPMISCTRVSKNGRRAGMSKPRILASARPMKIAAISPVSSRIASHPAATPITAASCALVPSTSPSRSLRSSSQSSAVPTTPPASPTTTLNANCASWLPRPLLVLADDGMKHQRPEYPADRVDQ